MKLELDKKIFVSAVASITIFSGCAAPAVHSEGENTTPPSLSTPIESFAKPLIVSVSPSPTEVIIPDLKPTLKPSPLETSPTPLSIDEIISSEPKQVTPEDITTLIGTLYKKYPSLINSKIINESLINHAFKSCTLKNGIQVDNCFILVSGFFLLNNKYEKPELRELAFDSYYFASSILSPENKLKLDSYLKPPENK